MMILHFLLLISMLPRVWLKTTWNKSEEQQPVAAALKDDELRLKRQATFFDLLHQAIEKYANCADEYLAPLKALVNFKQNEALIPVKHSLNNPPILSTAHTNQNKPNIRCSRVNLLTITNQNADNQTSSINNTVAVGEMSHTNINQSKVNLTSFLRFNGSDKTKKPFRMANVYGWETVPKKNTYSASYSQPHNQDFLNLFFKKPTIESQQQMLQAAGPESVLAKTATSAAPRCPCLNRNVKENKFQYSKPAENVENSPCFKTANNEELIGTTNLKPDVNLESVAFKNTAPCESKEFEQNLNQLLMQLNEMAERFNNEEFKQILDKLQKLKSAVDINFVNKEELSTDTTSVPFIVGAQPTVKPFVQAPKRHSFSNFGLNLGLLHKLFKTNSAEKNLKSTDGTAQQIKDYTPEKYGLLASRAGGKSELLDINKDGANAAQKECATDFQVSERLSKEFFESHNLEDSSEVMIEDSLETSALHLNKTNDQDFFYQRGNEMKLAKTHVFLEQELSNSQDLKQRTNDMHTLVSNMEKESLAHLNDFVRQGGHIEIVTRSPVLQLSHKNSQQLALLNGETDIFASSLESENIEETIFEAKRTPPITSNKLTLAKSNCRKQTSARVPNKNIYRNSINPESAEDKSSLLNKERNLNSNSSLTNKKDSKITISITSSGNFKHIKLEQAVPDNEKFEINEREKMNMGTTSSKGQAMDMIGTGSKYVTVVQKPQKNDSNREAILSEIYPGNSKFSLKAPLSIYLHKIQKQPTKLKRTPTGVWKTFQLDDVLDSGISNEKNQQQIDEGIRQDDATDTEDRELRTEK